MEFYIVKPGDTLSSIAREYNMNLNRLMADNGLTRESELAVGQCILIMIPLVTHNVESGESVTSIARTYGITLDEMLRNNTTLTYPYLLHQGQSLVISYDTMRLKQIETNGYTYPHISDEVLRKTLPYLTYISIFSYGFTMDGELIPIDDTDIIEKSIEYETSPVMVFSNIDAEQSFNSELATKLFTDIEFQEGMIQSVEDIMIQKKYHALDIDIEYILPEDREGFIAFVERITDRMRTLGYPVYMALAPKTSTEQSGILYEAHDYAALGAIVDGILLMTYEWGYTYGPPMAVSPVDKVREVLDYAVTQIPREKLVMGMPNYGYDWTLPFVQGESRANTITNVDAPRIAAQYGAEIMFDEVAQSPYFYYLDSEELLHEVWFQDARSVYAQGMLIDEYELRGAGFWNIMNFFPQNWLVMNALYEIIILEIL